MQRYDQKSETMFNMRFLMFKMREITHFLPKITHFKHFAGSLA